MKPIKNRFLLGFVAGLVTASLASILISQVFLHSAFNADDIVKIMLPPPFPPKAPADYNWTIRHLDGREIRLSELKGKVIFLTFWATWCVPCIAEMPNIERLRERLNDDRVAFVCASPEEGSIVSQFVQEKGYSLPVFTFEGDPPSMFDVQGYPATFIIAPDGRIVFKHPGTGVWEDDSSVEFIKRLLE